MQQCRHAFGLQSRGAYGSFAAGFAGRALLWDELASARQEVAP